MDKMAPAGPSRSEAEVATDLLASLLMERASPPAPTATGNAESLPPKIYAVMALTSLLTWSRRESASESPQTAL